MYDPNYYSSFYPSNNQPYMPKPQQPIKGLIAVTGIEGAKRYELPPNSVMPLFDADNDLLYVKSTDGAGFPTIKTFAFAPVPEENKQDANYIVREEFNNKVGEINDKIDELKELITNGKQSVQQQQQQRASNKSDK